jgi:eukaryotic-like serine/threonine-protein kinase
VAMKHVREDLPDVKKRRPEITAGLAAVLDRMTCKELRKRYADALTLQADLEEALTRELSRTGQSTGEATAVLRTLPEGARRRLPFRLRRRRTPMMIVAFVLLVVVAIPTIYLLGREAAHRTERGTGQGTVKPEPGTRVVSVKRTSATDFDPAGDNKEEHPQQAFNVVDKDSGTEWTTEGYSSGELGKDGVGIYIDADPGVDARSIEVDTPDPGWTAEIRAADGSSAPKDIAGWKKIAGGTVDSKHKRFRLDGKRHRYYLVWITALAPGTERVKIAEITLFAPKA